MIDSKKKSTLLVLTLSRVVIADRENVSEALGLNRLKSKYTR